MSPHSNSRQGQLLGLFDIVRPCFRLQTPLYFGHLAVRPRALNTVVSQQWVSMPPAQHGCQKWSHTTVKVTAPLHLFQDSFFLCCQLLVSEGTTQLIQKPSISVVILLSVSCELPKPQGQDDSNDFLKFRFIVQDKDWLQSSPSLLTHAVTFVQTILWSLFADCTWLLLALL